MNHLSAQLMLRYRSRSLTPAELLTLDRHLTDCERCRASLALAVNIAAPDEVKGVVLAEATAELSHLSHPALKELRDYLAQRLDAVDRELCESHLEDCSACAAQLTQLRAELSPRGTASAARFSWRERLNVHSLFNLPLAWRVAGVAALLGLLIWGVTRWRLAAGDNSQLALGSPTVAPSLPPDTPEPSPTLPESSSELLFAYRDGEREVTLDQLGNLKGLDTLTATEQNELKAALTNGQIETPPAVKEIQDTGNRLMSAPDNTQSPAQNWASHSSQTMLNPFGVILAKARPAFRWQALAGAEHYVVTISDPAANYREVAVSPKIYGTSWIPPQALPRNRTLTWQVKAVSAAGEKTRAPAAQAAEAKFRLLSAAQLNELKRGQQSYANQRLPLALLYARLGLVREARREMQSLSQANPQVPVFKKLLGELRAK